MVCLSNKTVPRPWRVSSNLRLANRNRIVLTLTMPGRASCASSCVLHLGSPTSLRSEHFTLFFPYYACMFYDNMVVVVVVKCLAHSFHPIQSSVSAAVILFVEVPFLLRICPTSSKFDNFIRTFTGNWTRSLIYVVMSVLQWLSLINGASTLLVPAIFLLLPALFYSLAALKSQDFIGSTALGGQGVAQMIV